MKNKQTAVEWLVEQLKERGYAGEFPPHLLFEQALAIEKEQHGMTWDEGVDEYSTYNTFEQYYNETYNK